MKQSFRKWMGILLALSVLCVIPGAWAMDPVSNGTCGEETTWTLYSNGVLRIEGIGPATRNGWKNEDVLEVQVMEGVTEISGGLFQDNSNLQKVSLPATLEEIGTDPHPFIYTPSLQSISVASGNSVYASQDGVVFTKDMKTLLVCPGGKDGAYTIPSSVTKLAPEAFFDCRKLTAVTIPDSVQELGIRCFYRCASLKKAAVPSGVKALEKSVFEQCESLASVTLPSGLTSIGKWAFWGDKSLTEISVPSGVTELGIEAFANCESLKKAVIPDSVKTFGDGVFSGDSEVAVYCSSGSPAFEYARSNGLRVLEEGEYIPPEEDEKPDDPAGEEGEGSEEGEGGEGGEEVPPVNSTGLEVGETLEFSRSATVPGSFLDKAFKASSSNPDVAEVTAIARTGNIQYANASQYFFSVWVKGVSRGTATITLYDNSKEIVIWKQAVTVTGEAAPKLDSVAFSAEKAKLKESVSITAVTSADAEQLIMYSGGKAVKTWTEGYTDLDGSRTWNVSYAFAGAGERTLEFRAAGAEGTVSEAVTAKITVVKAPAVSSVKFAKAKATVKQSVAITAVTSVNAVKLTMYSGSKAVQSWTKGYTDLDGQRTWNVSYAFAGAGERTLSFRAAEENGFAGAAKTAAITITKAPSLSSVRFAKTAATVKQNVTVTAVTSVNTVKLTMYNGKTAVKSWTKGYTDKDGKRTWNVTYAFSGAGNRTMSFRAADANGYAGAAKTAAITVTKAPSVSSVKFSKATAAVKQNVTVTAVTSANTVKLAMYSGSKLIKTWTKGYTDKDGKRTWKVTYAFSTSGNRTMSFRAIDANAFASAAKTAAIAITKP